MKSIKTLLTLGLCIMSAEAVLLAQTAPAVKAAPALPAAPPPTLPVPVPPTPDAPGNPATPSTPPGPRRVLVIDRQKYDPGETIFTGKGEFGNTNSALAPQQLPRLQELQAQLPREFKTNNILPPLAGKLSQRQLIDLEYFLLMRYNIYVRSK